MDNYIATVLKDFFNPTKHYPNKTIPGYISEIALAPGCKLSFRADGFVYHVEKVFVEGNGEPLEGLVPALKVKYLLPDGVYRVVNFKYFDTVEVHQAKLERMLRRGLRGVQALNEILAQLLTVSPNTALHYFLKEVTDNLFDKVDNNPMFKETFEQWDEVYKTTPTLRQLFSLDQAQKAQIYMTDSDYLAWDIFRKTFGMVTPITAERNTVGAGSYLLPSGEVLHIDFEKITFWFSPLDTTRYTHVARFSDRELVEKYWYNDEQC